MTPALTSRPRCAGRQCMNTASGRRMREKRFVYLIALEIGFALGRFLFLAHAGPHVGVDSLHPGDSFLWRVQNFNLAACLARHALRFRHHRGIRLVSRRRGHANMRPHARADR